MIKILNSIEIIIDNGECFGTDGFRGRVGFILDVDHAYKVGRFLGWY